jgi:uncharacterized protein YbgA (DUF1722 family)/uncharacterized protein YbbK (DUF523 family)
VTDSNRPIIALSSCLAGEPVRFDGAHKRDNWLLEQLGQYVDYRTYCPEVAIGLGIPRRPIRLVAVAGETRVRGVVDPSLDVTERLQNYAFDTLPNLGDISGYVFKSKSPSCGVFRVKRYNVKGHPDGSGRGAFAEVIAQHLPDLPIEEEGRLCDAGLRENFVNRVFAYRRWQNLLEDGLTAKSLIDFHSRHKYMVMAHSQAAYKRLGRLLAQLRGADLQQVGRDYQHELMAALARRVNRARHVNVLQHIQGYLKDRIDSGDKRELAEAIEDYRRGEVPLVVPMRLLQHYFRRHPDDYIDRQYYLDPYPASLGLRNHV